jgi:hypothetical protein
MQALSIFTGTANFARARRVFVRVALYSNPGLQSY